LPLLAQLVRLTTTPGGASSRMAFLRGGCVGLNLRLGWEAGRGEGAAAVLLLLLLLLLLPGGGPRGCVPSAPAAPGGDAAAALLLLPPR
jgi:hypothetical protein